MQPRSCPMTGVDHILLCNGCQEGPFPVFPIDILQLVLTASGQAFSLVQMCLGNHLVCRLCLPGFSCRRSRGLFQPSCLWFPLCWLWLAYVESTPSWKVDWMEQGLSRPVNFDLKECVLAAGTNFHFRTPIWDIVPFLLDNLRSLYARIGITVGYLVVLETQISQECHVLNLR